MILFFSKFHFCPHSKIKPQSVHNFYCFCNHFYLLAHLHFVQLRDLTKLKLQSVRTFWHKQLQSLPVKYIFKQYAVNGCKTTKRQKVATVSPSIRQRANGSKLKSGVFFTLAKKKTSVSSKNSNFTFCICQSHCQSSVCAIKWIWCEPRNVFQFNLLTFSIGTFVLCLSFLPTNRRTQPSNANKRFECRTSAR